MALQGTPYVILLIATAIVSAASALYVYSRHRIPGNRTMVLTALAGAAWLVGYALELASVDIPSKIFWNQIQYVGIVIVIATWLVFTFQYTGREKWLTRRTLILLSIDPILTLLLVFTNEAHGLIWGPPMLDIEGPFLTLVRPHGAGFWIHATYSYALLLTTAFLLAQMLVRSRHLYRRQARLLLFATSLPILGSALMIFGINPLRYLDLAPLSFTAASLMLTWSLFRLRVGDIVPVARDAVVESMSDGVIVLDEQNRIVDLNGVARLLAGHAASEAIGQSVGQIWPDWLDLIERHGEENGIGEQVALGEGRERRVYDLRVSPIVDWVGRITSRVIVLRDVTERREAEEGQRKALAAREKALAEALQATRALRESEEKYRFHFENVTDVMYSVGPDFKILDISPSVERVLGYKPEELIGRPFQDLNVVAADYLEAAASDTMRVLAGERVDSSLYGFIAKDGTDRIGEVSGAPLIRDGQVVAVISVARDVTERVRAEEALKESEERAQQQSRLAAVGQLAAGIAHDFNNIIATIIVYAQLLSKAADLSIKDRERLAVISQQAKRAGNLIEQILDFSRRSMLERQPLDLLPLLKELTQLLDRTLPESIQVALVHEPDEYIVHADPTRLQQVMMNLVINARDAMSKGGELCIRLDQIQVQPGETPPLPEMEVGEWVQVTVSDTGVGIPPDVLPHIYEPFFTTKAPGQGSGLGLAQVYGIVRQHEGYIDVASEVGHGTAFTFYLPALPIPQVEPLMLEVAEPVQGRGETLLLVEDDLAALIALRDTLETLNYKVLTACDGQAAMEVFERHADDIALVVSDLVMPKMGGRELVRELKKTTPYLKAVAVTGYALVDDKQELKQDGIQEVVRKPFEVSDLAEIIRQVLGAE
ncbi:MAG TPA: PAS domain S-box protein [Thermoflexia bacterium]|nr:PAS domain S-box protein [Thermoflexia bacterium]